MAKFKPPKMTEDANTRFINLKVQHYDKTLGRIICCIRKGELGGTFIQFAFCSPKDQYSRNLGRFIAHQRTLHPRTCLPIKLEGLSPSFRRMRIRRLALKTALAPTRSGEAKVPWLANAKLRWIK